MLPERLKGDRALPVNHDPGPRLALEGRMKTGAHLRLMSDNTRDDPTQPPSKPFTEEPPSNPGAVLQAIPPPARAPSLRPDPNSWEHKQLQLLVAALDESKAARAALDVEAIVQRQRVLFEAAIGPKLDTIAERLTQTEGDIKDLKGLRAEFEKMKIRMSQIETKLGLVDPATT